MMYDDSYRNTYTNGYYYTGGGESNAYLINTNQSSTGNITGVYDLNGGSLEYVMGNYLNAVGNSNLSITSINSKYIDVYTGDNVNYSILGDALGETHGWYSDFASFVNTSNPWFLRGSYYLDGEKAGVFYFHLYDGAANGSATFRPVLSSK